MRIFFPNKVLKVRHKLFSSQVVKASLSTFSWQSWEFFSLEGKASRERHHWCLLIGKQDARGADRISSGAFDILTCSLHLTPVTSGAQHNPVITSVLYTPCSLHPAPLDVFCPISLCFLDRSRDRLPCEKHAFCLPLQFTLLPPESLL